MVKLSEAKIGIIGLGYVGLPLAVEFGKQYPTVGYDISQKRIDALNMGNDATLEVSADELSAANLLSFSSDKKELQACNVYIVTVPTPIDASKNPDLSPLKSASKMLGAVIKPGDVVIYESTVFPGCTEEECVPVIEQESGLKYQTDFFAGYSPERINPGDKAHRLTDILKVTSGCNEEAAEFIDQLYASVIKAGTYKAESIRVAEAAKVIENTQRDLNIALVNELAIIFDKMGIDTHQVLNAAGTKWNFLPFKPGLVGGHCISVDPYYLTHKAQQIGYHPEVILAGRKINDGMGAYVCDSVIKLMLKKRIHIVDSKILIMGLTFKENCPDVRNTRVVDIINAFGDYHVRIDVWDPWVSHSDTVRLNEINVVDQPAVGEYDAVILCVAHEQFKKLGIDEVRSFAKPTAVIYDVKANFNYAEVDGRL
ncbi:MAG: nucleotide sugar dehydrogenase [Gammaproteobacteria bacterium]|nr:nucleotide sugar dehydrogenase [Gammaproteobacteria bacterium]